MKHLDLFTGIGGFAYAAQQVWGKDYEPAAFCEIDKFCQKVLKKHWPDVEIIDDIKTITENQWGQINLITAGFPCQDVSIAGKRKGLQGKQTGLFSELARVIEMVKPKWIVLENVPGLLSSNKGKDMAEILNQLSEIGYCVGWRVLDAQYFGVAQRRKRVFFVGSFRNTSAVKVLFEPKSSGRNDKKKQKMGQRGLCISTRDGERQDPTSETLIASTIRSNDHNTAENTKPNNIIAGTIQTSGFGWRGKCNQKKPQHQLVAQATGTLIAKTMQGKCGDRFNADENFVAQTIRATRRGNSSFVWQDTHIAEIDPIGKRAIDGLSRNLDSVRGRALGNAIVPQVVMAIMQAIKEINDQRDSIPV